MNDRKDYFLKYKKENYKRIPLDVTLLQYESIKDHTEQTKESVNGFIKRAINETIERDNTNLGAPTMPTN